MSPAPIGPPIQQCTLYLFASDADYLRRRYGRAWQEYVRNLVHANVPRHEKLEFVVTEDYNP